ncbi:hypothetical protein GCM10023097_31490 [Streptomyces collinus]
MYVPLSEPFASALPDPEEQAAPVTATTVDRATAVSRRLEELCMAGPSFLAHVCRGRGWLGGKRARRTGEGEGAGCPAEKERRERA